MSALPSPQSPRLRSLANLVLDAGTRDRTLLPLAIGISSPDPDLAHLHMRQLGGEHPVDDLLGFSAPHDWWAFGVVASATARPMTDEQLAAIGHSQTDMGSRRPLFASATAVLLASVVPRHGKAIGLLREIGGAAVQTHQMQGDPEGRVADACRRVLGRPTSPARHEARHIAHTVWLERLLREVIELGNPAPSCSRLRALHPLLAHAAELPDGDPSTDHEALARLGAAAGWPRGWGTLRQALTGHDEVILGVSPEIAAWMDDGMFQRWIEAELPTARSLVRDLGLLVSEAVSGDILAVMQETLSVAGGRTDLERQRRRTDS